MKLIFDTVSYFLEISKQKRSNRKENVKRLPLRNKKKSKNITDDSRKHRALEYSRNVVGKRREEEGDAEI